ncbi:UbiA family prenyltransferase [Deinococcus oregonensis]|uniref:UbiA family prenyltransferase n=1 Tax=Deinococcus oregonensis TaxID=1805970 RepID=A0ABV6B5Q9_9DEIO
MVPRLRSVPRPEWLPLSRLLAVSRPALWVNTVGTLVTGLWLSGHLYSTHLGLWVLLLYFTLPFNLLIYGLNDLSDRAEDARSGRKGGWQGARLMSGEGTPLLTAILAVNLPFLLVLAWLLPPAASLVLALSAGLFAAYSVPPLRFKGRPVLDGLSNVAYALPLVLPALVLGGSVPLWPLLALMAYSVGKHAFDAVQDIPADREGGTHTVATTLGAAATARYALVWFVLAGVLLWGESRLVALTLWAVCGGMALALVRTPTPERAARLYPLSIVSPWLVGTVAGVQLVYLLARQG